MKKLKPVYFIAASVMLGTALGYFFIKTTALNKQVQQVETQMRLQEKMNDHLKEIFVHSERLENPAVNDPYIRQLIISNIVDIDLLTVEEDSSPFSVTKNFIVKDYVAHQELKLEHKRLKKLLESYETDFTPCRVKSINFGFVMHEISTAEKILRKDFDKYKIPHTYSDKNKKDAYYLTDYFSGNARMLIVQNWKENLLTGYLVFRDQKNPIKVFHSNMKGFSCSRILSKLYESGDLEVTENNCEGSKEVITRYTI